MNPRTLRLLILVALIGVSVYFWDSFLLYPVKLFVVFLHEVSHGLAAAATGGEIVSIEISELIGGVCHYRGGIPFVVASAGYLGSLVWGGLILVLAVRPNTARRLAVFLGVLLLTVAALWVRNLFGIYFTAGFGVFLLACARYLPRLGLQVCLQFLGTASCLYVLVDIQQDLLRFDQDGSDAEALAQMTGVPAMLWGFLWGAMAVAMVCYTFYLSMKAPVTETKRERKRPAEHAEIEAD